MLLSKALLITWASRFLDIEVLMDKAELLCATSIHDDALLRPNFGFCVAHLCVLCFVSFSFSMISLVVCIN